MKILEEYKAHKMTLPKDCLLLFKLGDFYESYEDDAREVARGLDIAITKRGETPMVGFPYHMLDGVKAFLVATGYRVAIAERVPNIHPAGVPVLEIKEIVR